VAFGEAVAVFVADEFAVVILWRLRSKGAVEEQLPKSRAEQVGPSDDFSYSHFDVIDGAGELVAGEVVFSPNEEVANIAADSCGLWAKCVIDEAERFAVGCAESPILGDVFG